MNKKIIVMFVLSVLMISNVLALGITPGRTTFDYEPGAEKKVDFTVVNTEVKAMNIVVLATGELNKSISLSEVSFSMGAGEESKTLSYTLKIPDNLSPGLHTSEVTALQLPEKSETSEAFIGGVVGVSTQIHVYVPYPGKYAEAALNIIGPEADGKITFVVPVLSRGDLDLVRVRGVIDVYSSLNEKITTLTTNEISLPSKERGEIVSVWNSSGVLPGPYRAVATVLYDEDSLTLEKNFNLGERRLSLDTIEVNDFSLGEIAKFEILVENEWSEEIKGAYSQMIVNNNEGEVMADFKSPTYDVPALSKMLMIAFWDTAGVREGVYDSSLILKYGKSSDRQELRLEVLENEINVVGIGYVISSEKPREGDNSRLIMILIVVVVILIFINIVWFVFFRKRLMGSKT